MATDVALTAPLLEIFPAVQGEGLFAGRPQVFLRFGRCNVRCNYCDTPDSIGEPPPTMVHVVGCGASEVRQEHANPLGVLQVLELTVATARSAPRSRSVAITGGEPLLHAAFLAELLPLLRECGLEVLLETNGLLPRAMERLADMVDVASIDLKLEPELGVPAATLLARHEQFLAAAAPCPSRYVKIVVTSATTCEALAATRDLLVRHDRALATFLTPVTPVAGGPQPPSLALALELAAYLSEELADVRVLPQVHHLAGWR